MTYTYSYEGLDKPVWSIDKKYPVDFTVKNNTLTLKWIKSYSGQFEIQCNGEKKTIVVESLY